MSVQKDDIQFLDNQLDSVIYMINKLKIGIHERWKPVNEEKERRVQEKLDRALELVDSALSDFYFR